jgi:hypothetical protein
MRKEIRQIEVFISTDGREFDKEKDCISYEKELGFTIKSNFLFGNILLLFPFLLSIMVLPLYRKTDYWLVFGIMIFSGITSLLSITTLIYRKWKN